MILIHLITTRKVEISVGLFVVLGFIALLVLAAKVSNVDSLSKAEGYTVKAYFENVGGLREKAPVTMSGVKIGEVTKIRYDAKRYQAVVAMEIAPEYDFLSTDTQASIYTAGLLGAQYITLSPGAEDDTLKEGDVIQYTQSALVLEEIIGQFLVKMATDK